MTWPFHPRRALPLYVEDLLAPARRARVERHLAACERCRATVERHRAAILSLDAWPVESVPPPLEPTGVERSSTLPAPRRWLVPAGATLAVVALACGLVALRLARTEGLKVLPRTGELSTFEALALAEHAALASDRPKLDLVETDAGSIRRWLREHGELSADLVGEREPGPNRYALVGARSSSSGTLRAAAVATRIDGLPVTLLVGHEAEVDGLPSWSPIAKRLQVRVDPSSGAHLLSWKNAGKAYTLVTDPGVAPKLACRLCHTQPRRLETIERVAGEL